MEKNKKLINILEAIAMITFGVLVAIFGIRTFDIYFGVVFLVAGVAFLVAAIVGFAKLRLLSFILVLGFTACTTLGIAILANQISLGILVVILVYLIIALGAALIMFGIYSAIKLNLFYGIGQIVIGALLLTAGILYLTVPEFAVAFWIIVGVMIAIYGVLFLVMAITEKSLQK